MPSFAARYYDGKSAAQHAVHVEVGESGLNVYDAPDQARFTWRWSDVRLTIRDHLDEAITLRNTARPLQRLVLTDPSALGVLYEHEPLLRPVPLFSIRNAQRASMWTGVLAAIAILVFFVLPSLATAVAALIPLKWEERAGREIADRVAELVSFGGATYCASASGQEALDRLVARLEVGVDTPYGFIVRVVRSARAVNAVALPGGHILIFSGLIHRAASADEVAGVLAHEMGHVVERHPTEGWVRSIGLAAVFDALVGGTAGDRIIGGFAETVTQLSFTREAESDADRTSVQILSNAGIGTKGLADFFERVIERQESGLAPPAFLSTHPPSEERRRLMAESAVAGGPAMSAGDWQALRAICRSP